MMEKEAFGITKEKMRHINAEKDMDLVRVCIDPLYLSIYYRF